MARVIIYLLAWIAVLAVGLVAHHLFALPAWYTSKLLFAECSLVGGLGGVLYCLRGVYVNRAVRNHWDARWEVWYYLRPLTSGMTGAASYVFLKAGLLVLDANAAPTANPFGYLAFAFVAGYNVDNFLKRIEGVAESAWGIKPSRAGSQAVDGGEVRHDA